MLGGVRSHLIIYYWEDMMKQTKKPLFIPLKTEYYEAFIAGTKNTEYRRYGRGWNEKTCEVGREVVLSKGYGKQNRRVGVIISFDIIH